MIKRIVIRGTDLGDFAEIHTVIRNRRKRKRQFGFGDFILQGNFLDQVMTLKEEDWDDMDLIWDWLTADQGRQQIVYTVT